MKHIILLVSLIVLIGCTDRTLLLNDRTPSLKFDNFVKDEKLINSAVECVRQYIDSNTQEDGKLVLKSPGKTERRFKVVEIWDALSKHPDAYTIQVDIDEENATFPQMLLFRLERVGPKFRVIRIEYGGKHLRQTEFSSDTEY